MARPKDPQKELLATKPDRIYDYLQKLTAIFNSLPEDKKSLAENAIERASWLAVTIGDLETLIDGQGYTEKYKNGENQFGMKKNPNVETHIAMMQRYTQTMELLLRMLPEEKKETPEAKAIFDFMQKRPGAK